MPSAERVLIVGAGIGGLGAGALLAQGGIETEIVEIKPEPNVYGVGINQPGNSLRALREIGVLDEVLAAGYEMDRWIFHDHRGNVVVDVPSRLGGDGIPPNCALSRRALHEILIGAADRAGAVTRYGTTVAEMEDSGERVRVTFSDGREESFDAVVGFDGIKSPTRRCLFGSEHEPLYTGFAVWRLTVPRPPHIDFGALYQSPRVKAGHIPLSEETMYLLLVTPEPEGVHYDPADFPAMLRERLIEFEGVIGDIREGIGEDDDIVYSPLSEVMLPRPWSRGRIAVGGDAAHACTPHITQGAGMALEDGVVLADELGKEVEVEQALIAYAERRFPRAKFVQDVSRGILDAEMAISEETIGVAFEHMAAELPGQMGGVDDFLNQPV